MLVEELTGLGAIEIDVFALRTVAFVHHWWDPAHVISCCRVEQLVYVVAHLQQASLCFDTPDILIALLVSTGES